MAFWDRIYDWFKDRSDRQRMVRSFNSSAKEAFVLGVAPTLLKASISRGDRAYRTAFSSSYGGFRIQAMTGTQLDKDDIVMIGNVLLDNVPLVRRLVSLGFDTLEIHCDVGYYGCQWNLNKYAQIGVMLGAAENDKIEQGGYYE